MSTPNAFELNAREVKCQKFAAHFRSVMLRVIYALDEEQWKRLAREIGVKYPSPESRARIVEILKGHS